MNKWKVMPLPKQGRSLGVAVGWQGTDLVLGGGKECYADSKCASQYAV